MEKQKGRCPVCGSAMILGDLYVLGVRFSADLNWVSKDKIRHYKKSFLTGDEKEVNKRMSFKLLSQSLFSPRNSQTEGWYCPNCEKVFASFDAKRDR